MTRSAWCGLAASVFVALLVGCNKPEAKTAPVSPPPPVATNAATNAAEPVKPPTPQMPALPETVATIEGAEEIPVKAAQTGYLVRQVYKNGTIVAAGDVLFLMDPRAMHEGTSSNNSALVRIVSPVAGVPGEAWHGAGDWIDPNMELTGVARIDEVAAEVSLPNALAQQFSAYFAQLAAASLPLRPEVELILPGGDLYGEKGTLGTMASGGGVNTLSITFPNPGHVLRPGEFVKVRSAVR